jgi:hypothetical protein
MIARGSPLPFRPACQTILPPTPRESGDHPQRHANHVPCPHLALRLTQHFLIARGRVSICCGIGTCQPCKPAPNIATNEMNTSL